MKAITITLKDKKLLKSSAVRKYLSYIEKLANKTYTKLYRKDLMLSVEALSKIVEKKFKHEKEMKRIFK